MGTPEVLPHDLDAEQAVLGCFLIDPSAIGQVRDLLTPEDFYSERNRDIFAAACSIVGRADALDILTIKVELDRSGSLSRCGGFEYLAELSQKMPTAASVRSYARIVVESSSRRRLIAAATTLANSASNGSWNASEAVGSMERAVKEARLRLMDAPGVGGAATLPELDWNDLFRADEAPDREWAIEPLVPSRTMAAVYAKAKVGKSLLLLDVAAALASGRSCLGHPPQPPVSVVYVDLEMTRRDLRDRMTDMGYGIDADLSHFHYFLMPSLPPLDTLAGGVALRAISRQHHAELIVIDTMASATQGEEKSPDTYRAFYRYTGRGLKEDGATVVRIDHEGKDAERGQRGASAKNEDVDIVWKLEPRSEGHLGLVCTHDRTGILTKSLAVERRLEPTLSHILSPIAYLAGTLECAADLNHLGVPLDASTRDAQEALRRIGKSRRRAIVVDAMRYRR
ncbi:MAG: DnaB-like helicase N-terminal domain-containing protein [Candidatus Dormibacteria bacterium]